MKLIDLLARELESWPEGAKYYAQDYSGSAYPYTRKPSLMNKIDRAIWSSDWQLCGGGKVECRIASDYLTACVTREQWQSARDKLKGETKVTKPKANKDGWIRHRGGKCPVAEGTMVDVRYRDGSIYEGVPALNYLPIRESTHESGWCADPDYWNHDGYDADIMAYRIHAPEQPSVNITTLDTGAAWQMIDKPGEPNEALKAILALDAPMPAAKPFDGPLQWRDRIKEIDATLVALEDERSALIQRLADEGLALLRVDGKPMPSEPIKAEDSAQGDIGDWRNWMVGDLVEIIDPENSGLKKGERYPILQMDFEENEEEDGMFMPCLLEGCNIWLWMKNMKWHSRPSKP